jgi:two-component system, chemotaxis family, CheB/CheR fusion protein
MSDGTTMRPEAPSGAGPEQDAPPHSERSATVVAVGASAGGVEAVKRLLGALPRETNLSVVVVQHLSPSHESLLASALGAASPLPVVEVRDGMRVAAGQVHVIPPNTALVLEGDELRLQPRDAAERPPLPIDTFMRSLATRGERAIGVVLSGTGADGTLGLQAIRAAGGRTYAQDPWTAEHDGMPRSAIAADAVDVVLVPEDIARDLAALARGAPAPSDAEDAGGDRDGSFAQVLELLRVNTGVDVTRYKPSTLRRRIARRAALVHAAGGAEYVQRLRDDPEELNALHDDLFIHVTSFFRDSQVFAALEDRIFPAVLESRREGGAPVRLWVPGCSTGEEAYSIAIALLEFLEAQGSPAAIQVFATDISERAIRRARAAEYGRDIAERMSPSRLERFFEQTSSGFRVKRPLRDACVFVRHDVTTDPPFSRIDLLSCRNVLIYFGPELQKSVMPLFHYALNDGGFLLLGRTEALTGAAELFTPVDTQHRIYSRRPGSGRVTASRTRPATVPRGPALTASSVRRRDVHRALDGFILNRYTPPAVLVNDVLDIVEVRGSTGAFLEPASGAASLNLLSMARGGLAADLTQLVQRARAENAPARKKGVRLDQDGKASWVDLEVVPFEERPLPGRHFVVVFREREVPREGPPRPLGRAGESTEVAELREALAAAQAYVSSVTEQYAVSNQALAESNEQLQAANEELQSANEELETAKEELQSTNEELTTVNDELQARYQEVNELGNDLQNLVASVGLPIVIVDRERRVRRFTPKARRVFNLIPGDVGRAIADIRPTVDAPALDGWIAEVIESAALKEVEVRDVGGRWQRLQVRPYQTADRRIDGAVVTVVDIDALKAAASEARRALDFVAATLETVPVPVLVVDEALRVTSANEAFYRMFDVSPATTIGRALRDVEHGPWRDVELDARMREALDRGAPLRQLELELDVPDVEGHWTLAVTGRRIPGAESDRGSLVLAFQDLTGVRLAEENRARSRADEAQRFLNEAGAAMLPESLDSDATLGVLAHLVVPRLADWCVIDVVDPGGTIRQAAAAHVDPEMERRAVALRRTYAPEAQAERGVAWVIRHGMPVLFPEVEDVPWLAQALGVEHPEFLRELGARSYVSVPIRGRTGVIGALSLVRGMPGRRYGAGDLAVAEGLGQRAGMAVENARLYLSAQNAIVARDEFLAILSHELRNPLAPLRNSLHVLDRADPSSEPWRRAREVAERQVAHVTRVIDELLDVTRITHRKIQLHRANVELGDLVRRAAEDHRAVVEGRGVHLVVETPPDEVYVDGDVTRLVQVVGNLVQNAAKFTRRDDRVTVSLVRAGGAAEIHVRDTGAGIDPALVNDLFQPFTQAKQTLARSEGGLGLGLAFVKGIVELHGGTVGASSDGPGRGAEFTIRLPIITAPAQQRRHDAIALAPPRVVPRRVLIVDDNREAAETLAELVRMLGHHVDVAYDGPGALDQARRFAPEIVLCDIGLPGMTGYEVAKTIRAERGEVTLIALSGYARPEDVKKATDAGFDRHLAKPADPGEIERLLQ